MTEDYYLTPEDFEIAKQNGISAHLASQRVRSQGWKKQRAITEPVNVKPYRKDYAALAHKNGITYSTFMSRINQLHWSEERAATEPVMSFGKRAQLAMEARDTKIPKEALELAKKNGVKYGTLHYRVYKKHMDPFEAATKPVMNKQETAAYARSHMRPFSLPKMKKSV